MMIPELIKQIRMTPEEYQNSLWDYRISGNLLELIVIPDYSYDTEKYRMGVISAGRVIRAVDQRALQMGYTTQIQSFPSIEDSRLAALIRLHKRYGEPESHQAANGVDEKYLTSPSVLFSSIASHYGFCFTTPNHKTAAELKLLPEFEVIEEEKNKEFYSLCTSMDNPFVWIKTGQWLERIKLLLQNHPSLNPPLILTTLTRNQRISLGSGFDNCSYCQAMIRLD